MKRLFLTNPPLNMADGNLQYHRPLVPLGLGYLGAVVENAFSGGALEEFVRNYRGGSTRYIPSGRVAAQDNMFLSFRGRFDQGALLSRMHSFFDGCGPDDVFIGVSILSDGRGAARSMLRAIRASLPTATLMVGGPHATFFPLDFYEDPLTRSGPLADYIVRNEGEKVILAILNGELDTESDLRANAERLGIMSNGSDYSDPAYRVIDGGQFGSTPAKRVIDIGRVASIDRSWGPHVLDALPVPAYFLFEDESGTLPYEPDRRFELTSRAANINSSRGCPHHCIFCAIPMLAPGYRTLSPQRMTEITRFLVRYYGLSSLFFREDNFMYSGGSVSGDRWPDIRRFCEQLTDERLKVRWAIEARADNLLDPSGDDSKDRLDIMKAAGLSGVYIGVESGSDVMLKRLAKGSSVAEMSNALTACSKKDIAVVATSLYMDPDLMLKSEHPHIDLNNPTYAASIVCQRKEILSVTRAFMNAHAIPPNRREEYAMGGVPVSSSYLVLDKARKDYPHMVERYDPDSRYIYPKGYRWWADAVDEARRGG